MTFTRIFASDTTAAFLLPIVVLFWIVIFGSNIAGLLSLTLLACKRVQRQWGIVLGLLSTTAGIGGVMFFIIFTKGVGIVGWIGVLAPLIVGVIAIFLWKKRAQT
jgi:hypothetical protein